MERRRSLPDSEAVFTLVLLLISTAAFVATFDIRITKTADPFGPRLLPQFLSLVVMLGSAGMLGRMILLGLGARAKAPGESAERPPESTTDVDDSPETSPIVEAKYVGRVPKRLALVVAIVIYIVAMNFVGFRISTFLFATATLWILGERSKRLLFVMPIVLSLVLYYLFEMAFSVRLP